MLLTSTRRSLGLRLTRAGAFVACVFPLAVHADTIRVNGVVYENVYIGDGAQSYYIQNPADGSMIEVPKSEVDPADIQITPDRDERRRLRDMWRLKRQNRSSDLPSTTIPETLRANITESATERKSADAIVEKTDTRRTTSLPPPSHTVRAPAQKASPGPITVISSVDTVPNPDAPKPIRLSNIKNLGARMEGQKMFMDQDGVAVITNKPEQFEGRPEYVEVTIHFDPIEVPREFRQPPAERGLMGGSTVDDIIAYYAKRHALDPALVYAVIRVESNGNQFAVSSAGARGLMQLMPGTARDMGVKDIFDPAENIAGGTQYLSKMLGMFGEDMELALAGYNAGPGNVRKYGGIPPFKETQNYVQLVQRYHRQYKRSGVPQLDVTRSAKRVDDGYLPPESSEYFQLVLDNGLTVAAEQIMEDGDRYVYWFKGRSGHFPAAQVLAVREPTRS